VKELPEPTAILFLHPGITLPATLKVIFPATVEAAVMFLAWRKVRLPGASVRDAPTEPLEIVIVVAAEIAAR
jgi:hypothetical protein